jgi:hypothetical protein
MKVKYKITIRNIKEVMSRGVVTSVIIHAPNEQDFIELQNQLRNEDITWPEPDTMNKLCTFEDLGDSITKLDACIRIYSTDYARATHIKHGHRETYKAESYKHDPFIEYRDFMSSLPRLHTDELILKMVESYQELSKNASERGNNDEDEEAKNEEN